MRTDVFAVYAYAVALAYAFVACLIAAVLEDRVSERLRFPIVLAWPASAILGFALLVAWLGHRAGVLLSSRLGRPAPTYVIGDPFDVEPNWRRRAKRTDVAGDASPSSGSSLVTTWVSPPAYPTSLGDVRTVTYPTVQFGPSRSVS